MIISTFECKSFVQNSDITHKIMNRMDAVDIFFEAHLPLV